MRCALVLGLVACAGNVPDTRFYQLAAPGPPSPHDGADVALALDTLSTDPAYDDDRIVYRVNPYRLDYYNYHRWSAPPGTLIADFLERAFEASGRFRRVTRDTASNAPVTLRGRVVALEEVDRSATQWIGRVVLELALTDATTGQVLWSEQFEETEPLLTQNPEGLARALSKAVARIAARALPRIAELATQYAASR